MLVAFFAVLAAWSAPGRAQADRFSLRDHVDAFWVAVRVQDEDRLFGRERSEQPAVGRFSSSGGPEFVLDQSGARPMLRFESSTEIWVLRPSAGVRGDVYYRNDVGEVMLRSTRIGGLTLYTASNPGGLPCALEGNAQPLRLPRLSTSALFNHVLRETVRAGQALPDPPSGRARLEIIADDFPDDAADIVGDTATVSVDAIVRLGRTQSGRERLSGLRRLQIVVGSAPAVRLDGNRLVVTIAPRLGPAGRPSSARVMRALQG